MARVVEKGLNYGPLSKDFFIDRKVVKLRKRYDGRYPYIYLALVFHIIYGEGYYIRWDDDLPLVLSEVTGFSEEDCKDAINAMLDVDLLSKEIFESDKVLTSRGIQRQYSLICKQAKKKAEVKEFSLINSELFGINTVSEDINSEEKAINSEFIPQRKEKKSKVKEIKVKESSSFSSPTFVVNEKNLTEEEEKEVFSKIFYFKGFAHIDESVNSFLNWNRAPGRIRDWKAASSEERIYTANLWTERDKSGKPVKLRWEPWVGALWSVLHNFTARHGPGLLSHLFREGNGAFVDNDDGLHVCASEEICRLMEAHINELKPELLQFTRTGKLFYIVNNNIKTIT